jgi:hypothetical protein
MVRTYRSSLRDDGGWGFSFPALKGRATINCRSAASCASHHEVPTVAVGFNPRRVVAGASPSWHELTVATSTPTLSSLKGRATITCRSAASCASHREVSMVAGGFNPRRRMATYLTGFVIFSASLREVPTVAGGLNPRRINPRRTTPRQMITVNLLTPPTPPPHSVQ